jgi:hypothetical protein
LISNIFLIVGVRSLRHLPGKDVSTLRRGTYVGLPTFRYEVYKGVRGNEGVGKKVESCLVGFLE